MDKRLLNVIMTLLLPELKDSSILRKIIPKLAANDEFLEALKDGDTKEIIILFGLAYLSLRAQDN